MKSALRTLAFLAGITAYNGNVASNEMKRSHVNGGISREILFFSEFKLKRAASLVRTHEIRQNGI